MFESCKERIFSESIVVMSGEVQEDDFGGGLKFIVESVYSIEDARTRFSRCIEIKARCGHLKPGFERRLKKIVKSHAADACPIVLSYEREDACGRMSLGHNWKVAATDALLGELRNEFGVEQVKFSYPKSASLQLV